MSGYFTDVDWVGMTALAVLSLFGCGPLDDSNTSCSDPQPTFVVSIIAEAGRLPPDTVVTVSYGAGEETYTLSDQDTLHEIMFCTQNAEEVAGNVGGAAGESGDAGAAGEDNTRVRSLECELWTEGAATLQVVGGDFPMLEELLVAEADDCGIRTVRMDLTLTHDLPEEEP